MLQTQHLDVDPDAFVGLPPDEAEAAAREAGVEQIRVVEFVDGQMVGAMDMALSPNRLNLDCENGQVVRAHFGS
jgi:hypothetical protein